VKWLAAHPDRSAVQLNAFTVRILDRHASIHFRLDVATRARCMPITSNAAFASMMCGTRIFAVCLSATVFLRFFLPLVPSKVEQFMRSRAGTAQASIHEQHVLVG
jgi:hypothetical protein